MRKVLLIHGVNADTSWQDRIGYVLRPHFHPVKVTYGQYQNLGAVSLLGLEGILRQMALPFGVSAATINGYRMEAMKAVADQMTKHMVGEPPHIVAHSFGTYLTAIIFQHYDWARANRIIFAGSAVAEDFPWKSVRRDHALGGQNFEELRNDWFPYDPVIRLAAWTAELPGFGCAGVRGFKMVPGFVHNVRGPGFSCSNWQRGDCVPIHNVKRDVAAGSDPAIVDHSLVYLTPANVAQFWLPYLWGIDAAEYEDLRRLIRGTGEAHLLKDIEAIGTKVKQLVDSAKKYSWWPKPFREHLRDVLNSEDYKDSWQGKTEGELLGRIPAVFLARMDKADQTQAELIADCDRTGFAPEEATWDKVRDLHPHVALCRAIDQVIHVD